jgi:hypothetical protein
MPNYAIDVVVSPSAPVVDVTAVGVQGPPGVPGPPGPAGEPGPAGPAGTGNVSGPASATDNALALFDGATGKLLDAGPDGRISGSLSVGTAPAQSGAVRLGHDQAIMMRNGANTADLRLAASYGDTLYLGEGAALIVTQPPIQSLNNGTLMDVGSVAIGTNPPQSGAVRTAGAVAFAEMTTPAAPAANVAHLWLEDNGAGKSRLMVQFATGAAIQLAIQP